MKQTANTKKFNLIRIIKTVLHKEHAPENCNIWVFGQSGPIWKPIIFIFTIKFEVNDSDFFEKIRIFRSEGPQDLALSVCLSVPLSVTLICENEYFCLKWPSNNGLIHLYKRCVSLAGPDSMNTYCLKWPSNNGLIH